MRSNGRLEPAGAAKPGSRLVAILLSLSLLSSACGTLAVDELQRVASPDGRFEAVLMEWADDQTLDVTLKCGRVMSCRSFFWSPDGPPVVEVRLRFSDGASALCPSDRSYKAENRGADRQWR